MSADVPRFSVAERRLIAAVVVAVLAGLGLLLWALTSPILPAPDGPPSFGPMPASTAPPAPLTPDVSTAVPMHQRGPR